MWKLVVIILLWSAGDHSAEPSKVQLMVQGQYESLASCINVFFPLGLTMSETGEWKMDRENTTNNVLALKNRLNPHIGLELKCTRVFSQEVHS